VHSSIHTSNNACFNPALCSPESYVHLLGDPASLLVVMNTHPLLSLVCYHLFHPLLVLSPFHHRSSYNIYRDDINNTSRPSLAQYLFIIRKRRLLRCWREGGCSERSDLPTILIGFFVTFEYVLGGVTQMCLL
jgi:hypothetical protein